MNFPFSFMQPSILKESDLCMAKRSTYLNEMLIFVIILSSFLSYEINIYEGFYELCLFFVIAVGCFMFLINLTNKSVMNLFVKIFKANLLVHILSILLLVSAFFSLLKYGFITFEDFLRILSAIISFFVFYLFLPIVFFDKIDKKLDFVVVLVSVLSVIGILIKIRGSFWGYMPVDNRIAAIFFDPNYFGSMCAVGFLLSLKKRAINVVAAIICLIGLIFSGSRGGSN